MIVAVDVESAVVVGEVAVGLYDLFFYPFEEAGFVAVSFGFEGVSEFFAI